MTEITDELTYTKDDYRAAKAGVDVAYEAVRATPEWQALDEANARLADIQDLLGDATMCEGCGDPVFEDTEPCSYDSENGITLCLDCSPDWGDLLVEPEAFYRIIDGETVYHTPESAKAAAEAHLAQGGALTDKPFLTYPTAEKPAAGQP